ncbi:hypothetical protein SD77_3558 [Bacillus badius]|uniref:Ribose 5-phosphate isomerase B n=1 Tax=Bacillus badius TaxID=1455 RepID=A0ABR5AWN6_BACBA|nr:hypothetical protein SD77_3558 [Bacillus badius]
MQINSSRGDREKAKSSFRLFYSNRRFLLLKDEKMFYKI